MSGLDIFKHKQDPDYYYGVYHTTDLKISNFVIYLARSQNGLDDWETVTVLQASGSHAKVWVSPNTNDILMAYESSPGFDGNNIAIKHYKNLESMKQQQTIDELYLDRTLSQIYEGTPSFDTVEFRGKLLTSKLTLRFHYFEDSLVDQQAIGVYDGTNHGYKSLKNREVDQKLLWTTQIDRDLNKRLSDLGFKGSLGSR